MSALNGPARLVAGAAARTAAAGTARLLSAWSTGSPRPQPADRRCEGVADFAARRARVSQATFFTDGATAEWAGQLDDEQGEMPESTEMIYDGANAYIHAEGGWTGFQLTAPDGPIGPNDPLWPLDALFGASDDVAEAEGEAEAEPGAEGEPGAEAVRGVPATHYRLTIDLARADAALPAGISVPAGPYRSLRALPAEVWLDADGLARRIAVISDPAAPGEAMWSVLELWDFGVAADITPPAHAELLPPAQAYRVDRPSAPA